MARVKISEFNAKKILLSNYLGLAATPQTTAQEIAHLFPNTNLIVKVDQGIKKRGLQGLVKINLTPLDIPPILRKWSKLGWSNFLVESVVEHALSVERYLALERVRSGWQISFSPRGGMNVESSWDQLQVFLYPPADLPPHLRAFVSELLPKLDQHHISFLEMNPVLERGEQLIPLDMACEVDSTLSPIPSLPDRVLCPAELSIAALDAATPASLKFNLLNPDGSIWMLLSGGGASIVLADEVADQGLGHELANYGEYSGAPSSDDVYAYAKIILRQLLLAKPQKPRALIIAGGVANFTDVAQTFRGLIQALGEQKSALVKAKLKVFVRRGGPNEERGLGLMRDFLASNHLLGSVHGHETALTRVISQAKEHLS